MYSTVSSYDQIETTPLRYNTVGVWFRSGQCLCVWWCWPCGRLTGFAKATKTSWAAKGILGGIKFEEKPSCMCWSGLLKVSTWKVKKFCRYIQHSYYSQLAAYVESGYTTHSIIRRFGLLPRPSLMQNSTEKWHVVRWLIDDVMRDACLVLTGSEKNP